MVFSDNFSAIPSQSQQYDPPNWWNVVDLEENSLQIPLDQDSHFRLGNDWLTPTELEERSRDHIQLTQLRK